VTALTIEQFLCTLAVKCLYHSMDVQQSCTFVNAKVQLYCTKVISSISIK